MRLAQLLEGVPGILEAQGDLEVGISAITSDSRQVTPGALFVAYRGVGADGHRFVTDAVSRGAVAVVGEAARSEIGGIADMPYVRVTDGRVALAWLHATSFGHPSRAMTVVGVTGTDGKTTTSNLLFSILRAAGVHAGMISTVNAVIGDRTYDTGLHTTTPDALDVQRYLAQMRDAGTEVAVLETTSHGLAQHRVTGVDYDIAVVTNITHEHLDFHGSYEAYRAAKAMLFRSLMAEPALSHLHTDIKRDGQHATPKTAVLNADDSSFAYLAQIPAARYFLYAVEPLAPLPSMAGAPVTGLCATNISQAPAGMSFDVEITENDAPRPSLHLTTRLVGRFNVSNTLAACAAAVALSIDHAAIVSGIERLAGVPGRMERIDRGQGFTAIVDFAHTPNALAQALMTVRDLVGSDGRVIAVFGSAGLRDRDKRRLMGDVAARYADFTVITAEDPRTESLYAILGETAAAMVQAGRVEGRDFVRVGDRQAAILEAVRHARSGDVVIVCGKGHEQSMCFGMVEHPWRDQDALAWALDQVLGKAQLSAPPFVLPTWQG